MTLESERSAWEEEIRRLRQERDDLEIALATAIEHGDAIEEQMAVANEQLKGEIRERRLAESRLQMLMEHLKQQNADLEVMVDTVTEHSDRMDCGWLERFTHAERLALLDGLTQIANRRAFDAALEREWKRCQRAAQPLGLIMCDVDFFKLFNDRYGHQRGDACLVQVSRVLAGICQRPDDVAARYGGEEFALLLPMTDVAGLHLLAEGVACRLQELALPHERSAHGVVTLSQGGAAMVPSAELSPVELVAEADRQLYRAKREGRNTFRLAVWPE